ncbi:integrase [Paenibacillus sp. DS2015]|uniref:tyrosine-type recombinase/integrase n=1 Tax=Paenibacillus sp. DS2015 TaxID=3373917 RepID=UPI003D1AC670
MPSEKQCNELFDVINKYSNHPTLERIAFRLMLRLGFRSSETAQVKWSDINIYTKTIIVHSKGGKEHLLPLSGKLLEDIHSLQGAPPTSRYLFGNKPVSIQRKLRQNYQLYSLIAGWSFPGSLHIFRHTFVTRLAKQSVLPQLLKELGRFDKMDTVSLYLHVSQHSQFLANEINKLKFN